MGRAWCGVGLVWVGLAAAGTAHAQDAGDVLQVTARVSCIVEPSVEIMVRDPHSVCHWIMVWGNARIQPEGAVI